jgi:hypothetical protein
LKRHDFAESAARQDQKSRGGNAGGKLNAFALHLPKHLADPVDLGGAQKPFTLLLAYFLMCLRGFDPSGRKLHISARLNILEMISRHRLA